jgi:hypothetical protein
VTARQCVLETFRGEGVRGFFKGLAPPVLSGSFVNSGIFFGYGLGMAVLEPNVNRASNAAPQSYLNVYLAGCCGGFVQCHIVTPVELVKVKLQAQTDSGAARKYKGSFDCARQIVRANGLAGLYRGYHSLLLREVPSFGVYFASYEWAKAQFAPGKSDEVRATEPPRAVTHAATRSVRIARACTPARRTPLIRVIYRPSVNVHHHHRNHYRRHRRRHHHHHHHRNWTSPHRPSPAGSPAASRGPRSTPSTPSRATCSPCQRAPRRRRDPCSVWRRGCTAGMGSLTSTAA